MTAEEYTKLNYVIIMEGKVNMTKKRIIKKIAIPMMGLVIAGVSVLTPLATFASIGDSSSVSGSIQGIPCSGSTVIDYRSATATTTFYGTGTLTAQVSLVCKDKAGDYHDVTPVSKSNSAVAGVSVTSVRTKSNWEMVRADGVHTVKYKTYTWSDTTGASR